MIISRRHLEEFISLEKISDSNLADLLVSIGHEVASVTKYSFDDAIVVGKVLECAKHPQADKLSVCQVAVGEKTLQIVCGAKNVAKDMFVPVALVGATMPDGLVIKDAELRGEKSSGMIASAKELNLPDINDGILPLDNSIGDLIVGKKLNSYPLLADTIFELELTANRGDAFSVYGIARDLAAKLELTVRKNSCVVQNDIIKGVGRTLQLSATPDAISSIKVRVLESSVVSLPLLTLIRSKAYQIHKENPLETACAYVTHTTGVLFRAIDIEALAQTDDDRYLLKIEKDGELDKLVGRENLLTIGVNSDSKYFANSSSKHSVIVGYFVDAEVVSKNVWKHRLKTDDFYTKSAKGSESDLEFGMSFFSSFFADKLFFSESLSFGIAQKQHTIVANIEEIYSLIGKRIDKNRMVQVLKRLGVSLQASADDNNFVITPPAYRPDLITIADITEEIVRIMGIDSIESIPLAVSEHRAVNSEYKAFIKERNLANRAASCGFFETLNFLFCNKDDLKIFGFKQIEKDKDIANPITSDLNTLRPTLLIGLLESAKRNSAKSKDKIALFEIGDVVDSNRNESREMAFVFSGEKEHPAVYNHAKPATIDLTIFAQKIAAIFGDISLDCVSDISYLQNGQSATVILGEKKIGVLGKLHPDLMRYFDLETTFVAQIDLSKVSNETKKANAVSKFQKISRDLTVLVDKNILFKDIKNAVMKLDNRYLSDFTAVDIYHDEKLGEKMSLTIRIYLLPFDKSLVDSQINSAVADVLDLLKTNFSAELR